MAALPEEPTEPVPVKPDPDAGAPPAPPAPLSQSPISTAAAVATTAPPPSASSVAATLLADGEPLAGGVDSKSSVTSSPTPAACQLPADRQTLQAVLQFLRRSNLRESEEILRREARGLIDDLSSDPNSSAPGVPGAHGGEGQDLNVGIMAPGAGDVLINSITFGQTGATISPAAITTSPAAPLGPPGKGEI